MENAERKGPDGRSDLAVRLAGAVGGGIGMALVLFVGPRVGIAGFWPGLIAVAVAVSVGGLLGQFVGRLLFRP